MTFDRAPSGPPPLPARHRSGVAGLRPRRGWELHPGVRSVGQLSLGERAADAVRDILGSWAVAAAMTVVTGVGILVAVRHDGGVGQVTVLGAALCGLAVVELSFVLMAVRRSSRTAAELALDTSDSDRRAEAGMAELSAEVERLRADVARLTAQVRASTQRASREEQQ